MREEQLAIGNRQSAKPTAEKRRIRLPERVVRTTGMSLLAIISACLGGFGVGGLSIWFHVGVSNTFGSLNAIEAWVIFVWGALVSAVLLAISMWLARNAGTPALLLFWPLLAGLGGFVIFWLLLILVWVVPD